MVSGISACVIVCNITKEEQMDNRIMAYCAFASMFIGALFGFIGAGVTGLGFGALAGAGIGWFIGAAILENQKQKKGK
jgi:hypothetical protein